MRQERTGWSRQLLSLLLAVTAAASMTVAAFAAGDIGNFKKTRDYAGFSDVSQDAWYYNDVRSAYELGLISGSDGKFNPNGNLTLAEAITMACNVCHIYENDDFTPGGSPWYQNAVDYAVNMNIISEGAYSDYNALATRADVARMFEGAITYKELARINRIAWIPDVDVQTKYVDVIYALYNAGVLTGGESGEFRPGDNIKRSEAAAILNRLVDPSKRVKYSITGKAPGVLVESEDSMLRLTCAPDRGWELYKQSTQSEGDIIALAQEDGSAQIEFRIVDKSTTSKTIKEWSEDALQHIQKQGYATDDLYAMWIRGLDGYNFSYEKDTGDGTPVYGEYFCVENSKCLVYAWMIYNGDCTDQTYNELIDILYSIDLAL